ncbi:MAG TPA: homocysteine S-methyltransferase family protein [Ignavibacteriales bacterium]|nr:homocysteine S-methyltransferase family protein [Ignavibacteriales bacterium]
MRNTASEINIFGFTKRIGKPLLLDGSMGHYLKQLGFNTGNALWSSYANIVQPDLVIGAHQAYINAGADIITTNTFRTNPEAVNSSGLPINVHELVKRSVKLARQARDKSITLIAGSNAPAEDCYQTERKISEEQLKYNHHKHIELLMLSGCDLILNETQSHMDEILIISEYCSKLNIPYVISLYFDDELRLLSSEPVLEAVKIISQYDPMAISFNCVPYERFIKLNLGSPSYNWGAYFNCILKNGSEPKYVNENVYASQVNNLIHFKPSFIGGCCGSTPAYIKLLKEQIYGLS